MRAALPSEPSRDVAAVVELAPAVAESAADSVGKANVLPVWGDQLARSTR